MEEKAVFGEKPKCHVCSKEIKGNDVVYVKMRYPSYKGMTEITAYLRNEGSFVCEDCFEKK
ncbi:Fe3+ hydroxamate ABC transporter substrate-binding protein [Bacillus sp. FJAT-27251]|uniref:Fe3+ hydroxamate ABC transporter substrate-binding protein n=1 Tax=Bacillus sp. FJAT-27251 TaxID=1684142 RepID=UPI0009E26A63|nr:Fe3+ hydroxamate ABC transporter substrate-binding protein [Bacillus sp. FJAT-27251]